MNELDEAIFTRRSEQMLHEHGLDRVVVERIWRERMPADNWNFHFNPAEREGLMILAEITKEVSP